MPDKSRVFSISSTILGLYLEQRMSAVLSFNIIHDKMIQLVHFHWCKLVLRSWNQSTEFIPYESYVYIVKLLGLWHWKTSWHHVCPCKIRFFQFRWLTQVHYFSTRSLTEYWIGVYASWDDFWRRKVMNWRCARVEKSVWSRLVWDQPWQTRH